MSSLVQVSVDLPAFLGGLFKTRAAHLKGSRSKTGILRALTALILTLPEENARALVEAGERAYARVICDQALFDGLLPPDRRLNLNETYLVAGILDGYWRGNTSEAEAKAQIAEVLNPPAGELVTDVGAVLEKLKAEGWIVDGEEPPADSGKSEG